MGKDEPYFANASEQMTGLVKEQWCRHDTCNRHLSYLYHDDWSTISIQLCLYTGHHIRQISLYILHIRCELKTKMLTVNCHSVRNSSSKQEMLTRVKIFSYTY
jgi:hypothetical protein